MKEKHTLVFCILMLLILLLALSCIPIKQPEPQEVQKPQNETQPPSQEEQPPVEAEPTTQVKEEKVEPLKSQSRQDVTEKITEPEYVPKKTLLQEFLENAPSEYWFWNEFDGTGAVVSGFKMSTLKKYETPTKVFWASSGKYYDLEEKTVFVFKCIAEKRYYEQFRIATRMRARKINFTKELMPIFVKYPLTDEEIKSLPKSPIDWMKEYQYSEPSKILTSKQALKLPLSGQTLFFNLSLQFNDPSNPNAYVVFKFHPKFKVPVGIEVHDFLGNVRTYNFEFGITSYISFDRPELKEIAELPKDHIVLSEEEADEFCEWQAQWNRWEPFID